MSARIALIAAVGRNGVIGADGGMPWRLSSDLKRFKSITLGKPVVMGRKTFESIGKPLAGRTNIVISRRPDFAPDGVIVRRSLDDAIAAAAATGAAEIMVIGGGEIYAAAIGRADRLYLTHVEAEPAGDAFFPPVDPDLWAVTSEERLPAGAVDSAATTFKVYERRTGPRSPG